MAGLLKDLSNIPSDQLPDGKGKCIGIVRSEWNKEITHALYSAAHETLITCGVEENHLFHLEVPGTYELAYGAQRLAQKQNVDAVICLGCVIQGETPHFDYICQATAHGILTVGLKYDKPCIFGVLTTLNLDQAKERAGGKFGNKGVEAALTALQML